MQKLNINDTKHPFLLLKISYIIFKNMKLYGILYKQIYKIYFQKDVLNKITINNIYTIIIQF